MSPTCGCWPRPVWNLVRRLGRSTTPRHCVDGSGWDHPPACGRERFWVAVAVAPIARPFPAPRAGLGER